MALPTTGGKIAPTVSKITPPRVPLVDPNSGMITESWYKFFLGMFRVTDSVPSLDDVQLGPPSGVDAALTVLTSMVEAVRLMPTPATPEDIAVLQARVAQLAASITTAGDDLAPRPATIDDLALVIANSGGDVTALREEVHALEAVVAGQGTHLDALQVEADVQALAPLPASVDALHQARVALQARADALQAEADATQAAVALLGPRVDALQAASDLTALAPTPASVEALHQARVALQAQIDALQPRDDLAALAPIPASVDALHQVRVTLQARADALQAEADATQAAVTALQLEADLLALAPSPASVDALHAVRTALQTRVDALQAALDALTLDESLVSLAPAAPDQQLPLPDLAPAPAGVDYVHELRQRLSMRLDLLELAATPASIDYVHELRTNLSKRLDLLELAPLPAFVDDVAAALRKTLQDQIDAINAIVGTVNSTLANLQSQADYQTLAPVDRMIGSALGLQTLFLPGQGNTNRLMFIDANGNQAPTTIGSAIATSPIGVRDALSNKYLLLNRSTSLSLPAATATELTLTTPTNTGWTGTFFSSADISLTSGRPYVGTATSHIFRFYLQLTVDTPIDVIIDIIPTGTGATGASVFSFHNTVPASGKPFEVMVTRPILMQILNPTSQFKIMLTTPAGSMTANITAASLLAEELA